MFGINVLERAVFYTGRTTVIDVILLEARASADMTVLKMIEPPTGECVACTINENYTYLLLNTINLTIGDASQSKTT